MKNLFKVTFEHKETCCNIISDKEKAIQRAIESLKNNRRQLEGYIENHPIFLHSLEPISPPKEPLIAKLMAEAAEKAKVGPMAAVAGVLADLAVKDMLIEECEVAVIENGGEVSAISTIPVDVALAAGDEPLSKKFGFRLEKFPSGIATSSGKFSHAFSFGDAEAATVFCNNAGLADAAATAVCNVVKGEDCQKAVRKGIEKARSIAGVKGVLIMYQGFVGIAGEIPQILRIDHTTN